MSNELAPGIQDRRSTIMAYVLVSCFIILFFNTINLPRTALDQRATLRLVHDSFGLIVLLLAAVRLYWHYRDPAPRPPPGLPERSFAFNRTILVFLYATFAITGVIGFIYAWGEGRDVVLFGITLPHLVARSESVRVPTGYLHSSLGFYYLMLLSIWFAFGFYQHWRYKVGLRRLLPGRQV
ncbi:MAG: cytochrome b/b6 domain-containing protein [Gammaproteobacteria bacterium]|jgi:cytochrome b561|nr:cytochrome b/b6 domain-containing protein [Gammaproteobacteria bacterium]